MTPYPHVRGSVRRWPSLVLFVVVVLAVGLWIGYAIQPGAWYDGLNKPSFNPPKWLFAPVWTTLYVMIAVAGWRVWGGDGRARLPWVAQMLLNWAWTPIFFGAHAMWAGLGVILALLVAVAWFIVAALRSDKVAALLFLPYLAWVAFAALLNASLAWLN